MPPGVAIDAEVDLSLTGEEYYLQTRLNVSLLVLDREVAHSMIGAAHQTSPYSTITRGHINVILILL